MDSDYEYPGGGKHAKRCPSLSRRWHRETFHGIPTHLVDTKKSLALRSNPHFLFRSRQANGYGPISLASRCLEIPSDRMPVPKLTYGCRFPPCPYNQVSGGGGGIGLMMSLYGDPLHFNRTSILCLSPTWRLRIVRIRPHHVICNVCSVGLRSSRPLKRPRGTIHRRYKTYIWY